MEKEYSKRLSTLIEVLTHSGSTTLDENAFKEVKKICKSSEDYIQEVYKLVIKQLKKKNSQIRYLAFQICKELFVRSGLFRELVLTNLQLIFELSVEINASKKLPPPKASAKSLKTLALSTLKQWLKDYGDTHKELKVAYNYLEKCKRVDFETLEVGNSAETVVENEQQRRIREINNERITRLMEDFTSNESEIESTIVSLSNCINLLLPPLEDFFIPENNLEESSSVCTHNSNKEDGDSEDDLGDNDPQNKPDLRQFGLSSTYSLSLELNPNEKPKIIPTEENSSVIENAKDCVRLINNRFLPMVKKWSKIYCKYSNSRDTYDLKKIIDLKRKLESILKKYESLNIEGEVNIGNEDESESDFEEVKKEDYEDAVEFSEEELLDIIGYNTQNNGSKIKNNKLEQNLPGFAVPSTSKGPDLNIPSVSGVSKSESQEVDRKKKLLAVAPKLPYDIDLYHWEDEKLTAPTLLSTKIDVDKFWGCAGSDDIHEIPNPEGVAALRTRVIEFSGKFEPVKWACRTPLPNGKLCPRKDRYKCPFHGKIVARDETGKCQNPEDEKIVEQSLKESSKPEWQDTELLQDLQAATGIDLKMPERKGKRKKNKNKNLTHKKMKTSSAALRILEAKKLPGLVDVVRKQNNSYTRLSKKIFNRSSMRRVSAALNKLDKNKFKDKFGDQFNYS